MKKSVLLWIGAVLMIAVGMSSCSSSDEDDDLSNDRLNEMPSDTVPSDTDPIVGTWELKTLHYDAGSGFEIPVEKRDLFIFGSNGKVKVIIKIKSDLPNFPNEDGEYDYFYDKEKQTLQLCGKTRECIIKDSVMYIASGYASDCAEVLQYFAFQKCETQEPAAIGKDYDFAPIEFRILITDNDGHDLLDSTYQDNLIKNLSVTYQGKDYPLLTEQEAYKEMNNNNQARTRAYMPIFRGLVLYNLHWGPGLYEMDFGEFSGSENVDKLEITLNLPNHQQVRLAYMNNLRWTSNGDPEINRTFFFNDQELNDEGAKRGYYHLRYSSTNGVEYVPSEMTNYYGTFVPYTPIEEVDLPEWLRELKSEKRMFALWRICVGTLNDEIVWHLNLWTDSSLGGHLYDKDGNFISFGNDDLIKQIRYVRCVYYKSFSSTQ